MMLDDSGPFALGGGHLAEGNLVRLIYTDEAGTSAKEPVCVVATVIVHGDHELRLLQEEMRRIVRERVPSIIRSEFTNIHATEIYSGGKHIRRDQWTFDDRLEFLKEIMRLPFVHNIPISVGVEFKGKLHAKMAKATKFAKPPMNLDPNSWAHVLAFNAAMERADAFLRTYLHGKEIGTVVAEDVDRVRKALTNFGLFYRDTHLAVPADEMRSESWRTKLGYPTEGNVYRIDHIIDVPHFVEKGSAPLLQLADVCAFAFRHCLSRRRHGNDLVMAMLGPVQGQLFVDDDVWFSGASSGLFNTECYWSEEKRRYMATRDLALQRHGILPGQPG